MGFNLPGGSLESLLGNLSAETAISLGGGAIPRPAPLPVQLPQLRMPMPAASGMPGIRDRALANVLGPLMMPNFGLPMIPASGLPGAGPVPTPIAPPMQIPQPVKGRPL